MEYHYVVRHPLPRTNYKVGDIITDQDEIAKWTVSHPDYLIRINTIINVDNDGDLG